MLSPFSISHFSAKPHQRAHARGLDNQGGPTASKNWACRPEHRLPKAADEPPGNLRVLVADFKALTPDGEVLLREQCKPEKRELAASS